MAVATCFGSPLLNDILGLGIALTLTCGQRYPAPFVTRINTSLLIAWGFLGVRYGVRLHHAIFVPNVR